MQREGLVEEPASVFERDGELFVPTRAALSPWSSQLLHGGPVGGLLARAVVALRPNPAMLVARLTVDLFRPVPAQPLRTEAHLVREGRRIAVAQASLFAGEAEVSRATGLMLLQAETPLPRPVRFGRRELPAPDAVQARGLWDNEGEPRRKTPPGFHTTLEVRPFRDEMVAEGGRRAAAWIRMPLPLVAGEPLTPYLAAASIADFANGLGHIRAEGAPGFINTDITLNVHREPVGEWIFMEVESAANERGIGMNHATLSDIEGPFGMVAEALLANPR